VGLLWTPPYWAWVNGAYLFNAGYWGPTVGFYGGIAYGFGYPGTGFFGGFWRNNVFVYNTTVNNFGAINIANSFSRPVFTPNNHVAFNGRLGGSAVDRSAQEARPVAFEERHISALAPTNWPDFAGKPGVLIANENPVPAVSRALGQKAKLGQGAVL